MTYDLDTDGDGIKGLRKQFKEQQKQIALLLEQNTKLQARQDAVNVSDLLASRGLDPRVAKFYPEGANTDKESVDQWIEENQDYFGGRRITDDSGVVQDNLTDAEKRGYQILQDMSAYETGLQQDWKTQLDSVQYDRDDPIGSQDRLLAKIEELARTSNM